MFVGCLMMCVGVSYASLTYFGDLLRRTAPKFGTHVRIDTITLKMLLTHPTLGGLGGYLLLKNHSRRVTPKFGTHVRIKSLTLKKNWPTPPQGGLGGYLLFTNLLRRTAPKFGTHVRIAKLTLTTIWPTPPQGGLGGYLLLKIFRDKCDHSYPWWVATGLPRAGRFER